MFKRILTVCTGNICRSPMAEALLARRLRERGVDAVVESAGTFALEGRPPEPEVLELMQVRGLDVSAHRARQVTPGMARAFDLILVMEASHQREVEALEPSARGRVHRLGRVSGFDVPDPYGQKRPAFEQALALIERGIAEMEKIFWSGR